MVRKKTMFVILFVMTLVLLAENSIAVTVKKENNCNCITYSFKPQWGDFQFVSKAQKVNTFDEMTIVTHTDSSFLKPNSNGYEGNDFIAIEVWLSSQAQDWEKQHVITNPTVGQSVYFYFSYGWVGDSASPVHHVQLKVNGEVIGEGDCDPLDPGYGQVLYVGPWSAVQGQYTFTGIVDSNNAVQETDETNNQASMQFTVGGGGGEGDFAALEQWISSQPDDWNKNYVVTAPRTGQQLYFYFTYSWDGDASCGTHHIKFSLNAQLLCEGDIEGFEPGYSMIVYCGPWSAIQGQFTFTAVTDSNNDITETDEGNNEKSLVFAVTGDGGEGDLKAEDAWFSSQPDDWDKSHLVTRPLPPQSVYMYFQYSWTGTSTCPTHHVTIKLDGHIMCEGDVPDLPAQSTISIYCPNAWSVTLGTHTLKGETDTNDDVDESNENNNVYSLSIGKSRNKPLFHHHLFDMFPLLQQLLALKFA